MDNARAKSHTRVEAGCLVTIRRTKCSFPEIPLFKVSELELL